MRSEKDMPVDARILGALRSGTDGVSGAELAQRLGISRAAVWARIEELRRIGYQVEATPHQGYRFVSAPDALHGDDLMARLGPLRVIGRDIRVFEETGSTNDVVEKLARDGVQEGVVVFAESQSRGRGRLGRKWLSPARRGLWFSVLLRPTLRPQAVPRITIMAAVAVWEAVREEIGLQLEVKWPNDLLAGGKKVAGILTEMSGEQDRVKHVILGIGVDANLEPSDLPKGPGVNATSLSAVAGRQLDRSGLATAILRALDAAYEQVAKGGFEAIADRWEANCSTIGQQVDVRLGDRRVRGRAETLDEDGALLVRTEHGRLERVTGGDVTVTG